MNNILYFRSKLIAASPLIIGSGTDDNTDSDILTDSDGKPYIPGTTLAGICRHYLLDKIGKDKVKEIFGYTVHGEDKGQNSNIIFYDARLKKTDNYSITMRDGVKLKNKNAIKGGKFDYEIIEAGSVFDLKIELKFADENCATDIINEIINGFNSRELYIGAKTTRGFGQMQTNEEKFKTIDLKTQMQDYICFSWDNVTDIYEPPETKESDECQYKTWKIEFDLRSFLFIRNYATTARVYDPKTEDNEDNEEKIVDAEQLLNKAGNPVIPGTSWAGAFRSHFLRLLKKVNYSNPKDLEEKVFGYVINEGDRKGEAGPSKIIFSESVIENSHQLNRTRNAIDRFTGGAGDKKLFTTRPTYKGKESFGILEIKLCKPFGDFSEDEFNLTVSIIEICIKDLNAGYLTVGGETSTGGGLIKIKELNGEAYCPGGVE
jgi:CRISPR/Cas system CSM-associated protein Csm3 (group 7 of RAMP superfamily)